MGQIEEAQAAVTKCEGEVLARRTKILAEVAEALPRNVDAYAKSIAQRQPGVTKNLGHEGVEALRTELRAVADDLAGELVVDGDKIAWSNKNGEAVHSSLFPYFYGPRLAKVSAVLRRSGFDVEHAGILPQYLYQDRDDAELNSALSRLQGARARLEKARADADRDSIDEMWN
ncbi:hypothetical protein CH267_00145 [Rhodococcus sp. 06-621-2]|nr:hypothetical protein [Rhodococcus sp. 06-621-2]OZC62805.1 hypothetical protein CH267_00145 [Rhodococcus sp. 06-621-2]